MPTVSEELHQAETPWLQRLFLTAAAHYEAGRLDESRQALVEILEKEPRHPESMFLMASIAGQSGDLDLAEDLLKQALAIDPFRAAFWVLLGNVLQRRLRLSDAMECYAKAIGFDPGCAEAFYELGNTLGRQGSADEAARAYIRTLALRHDHVGARIKLAAHHRENGRLEEARKLLELARGQDPRSVGALVKLASIYLEQRRHTDALLALGQAIEAAPRSAELYNNKGNVLLVAGRLGEALDAFAQSIECDPARAEPWANRGHALRRQGRPAEALDAFRKAIDLDPADDATYSAALWTLHHDPAAANEALLKQHRLWEDRHARADVPGPRTYSNTLDPGKRLRIGYVSPDLRRHSVAYLLAPVLERHSAHAFCYATSAHSDLWTERLQKSGAVWRDAAGLSDEQLAAQIAADHIDILVDLSGHAPDNRLKMFANRPAPVAVSWLGYRNTTGLKAMDYLLVDRVLAPEEEPAPFVETPLRTDGCFAVYAGPSYAPAPAEPPCLHTGHITYGCFASLSKVTPQAIELWAHILKADRRAHLMLKNPALDDAATGRLILEQFERLGVDAARIELWGGSPHAGTLAWYANIDIALDPFPYNGLATTCEAMWMGVPVITLAGNRMVSRVGASLLSHAGLRDWITHSADQYVERALALGADTEILRRIRMLLRDQVSRSSLGDTKAFVRRLEDVYRTAWRRYCAGRQPGEAQPE